MVLVALPIAFALQPGIIIKLMWCSQVYYIWLLWQTLRCIPTIRLIANGSAVHGY